MGFGFAPRMLIPGSFLFICPCKVGRFELPGEESLPEFKVIAVITLCIGNPGPFSENLLQVPSRVEPIELGAPE